MIFLHDILMSSDLLPVSEMWPTKETDWNRVMDDYMRDCNCIFSVSHLHRIGAVINLTAYNLKTGTTMQCGKQLLQHKHWDKQRCLVNIQCAQILECNNKVIPESWSVSSHRADLLTRSIIPRTLVITSTPADNIRQSEVQERQCFSKKALQEY